MVLLLVNTRWLDGDSKIRDVGVVRVKVNLDIVVM